MTFSHKLIRKMGICWLVLSVRQILVQSLANVTSVTM
ncbi:Uncharacterised protein [Vibrio cholerae]|uniref:Uncharacterized protein n=1 Tax=Vibrio cholerae TaxID=666 RepID=A0A655RD50_VIBCL|nr:Uncharacterised protein [Vibrio cholerae]